MTITPQIANVGLANNDHNGDTLRSAMQKFNQNFTDIYAALQPNASIKTIAVNTSITVGNASVYSTVNSTYYTGTAYNSLQLGGVNANVYIQNSDSTTLSGNLNFTGSNVTLSSINAGNSTLIANTSGIYVNATINASSISVSNTANVATLKVSNTATISGNLLVGGTLFVAGNTTYINATVITTSDKNLWLANTAANTLQADGSGLLIGSFANLIYVSSNNAWQANVNFIPAVNNLTLGPNTNMWNLIANNANANYIFANSKIQIGNQVGYNFGTTAVIEIDESQNTYVQIVLQNANSGIQASGDLIVTADTGNDSTNYVDLGINSSNYSNATYGITGPLDAYLYSSNSQLVLGTASVKDVVIHAGGTLATNRVLTINTTAVTVANSQTLSANVISVTNVNATTVTANVVSNTISATTVTANIVAITVNATSVNATSHISGNAVHNTSGFSVANNTANAVVNNSGMYVNSIPLQTIQNTFKVDFGSNAVYTTRGTISDSRVTANSSVTTVVSVYPSGANSLANGTSNTVFYGDELEMDTFQCAAYVSTNGTINYYITAIPGPVSNTRIFNYILS